MSALDRIIFFENRYCCEVGRLYVIYSYITIIFWKKNIGESPKLLS